MGKNLGNNIWRVISTGGTILAYEAFISRRNSSKIGETNQVYIKAKLEKLTENQEQILLQNENFRKSLDILINKQSSSEAVGEATSNIMEHVENVTKGNNLIDYNFTQLIETYKEFLSTLSLEQLCFIINITSSLFILSCVFSIFSAYLGNQLIERFKLENKFPKLSKFIKLRVKFQEYYILTNLLIITLSLFFIIYINYLSLIT